MKQGNVKSLPKGWETKKLVDVCIVERGSSPRPIEKYQTDSPDGVNWIKIGDTKNVEKYIYTTREKITKEGAQKSRYVKEGDFILSNSMSFGKPFIMKTDGYIHDGWFALRLHNFIDTEYFYHLLSSPLVNDQFHKLASGSVVKNISGDLVKKVVLPIPPLQEQQRIVTILDEAFTAIDKAKANTEQNLKNAKELFESELQRVFSEKGEDWLSKPLGELATFRNGMNYTKSSKGEVIKIAGVKDFKDRFWVPYEDLDSFTIDGKLNEIDILKEGDIIAVRSNGNPELIGRTLLAGKIDDKVSHSGFTIRIRLNSNIVSSLYLCRYLKTSKTRKELVDSGNGVGIRSLNQGSLSSLMIPFPKTIKEQQTIVSKLDALREQTKKLEAVYTKKLQDLEELKKSVLSKAFSGEFN